MCYVNFNFKFKLKIEQKSDRYYFIFKSHIWFTTTAEYIILGKSISANNTLKKHKGPPHDDSSLKIKKEIFFFLK